MHAALLFVKRKELHVKIARAFKGRRRHPQVHAIVSHVHKDPKFLQVTRLNDQVISTAMQ